MAATGATPEQVENWEQSERRTVTADGHTVAYAEYGSADGRPLLVFHGTPGSRLLGRLFDAQAREHRVRVLAIDRPGYGGSDDWSGFGPADVGRLVAPVLDDAGVERTDVVGFSGGAPFALALAALEPDLVGSVDLVSPAVPASLREETPRQLRLLAGMARATPRLFGGLLRTQAWLARRGRTDVVVGQYTDPERVSPAVTEAVTAEFVESMTGSTAGARRELARRDADPPFDIEELDQTVSIWHGADDANVPVGDARRLAGRLPTASVTELDADHLGALLESRTAILADSDYCRSVPGQPHDSRTGKSLQ